ncbi:hypothetical protein FF38_00537 [Lucilia cuprina]|uniref:Uncharacterized protein n=1 Tax=Lucilia cuprina TaxID=7375 RepID=A0A0L0BT27_LUCCU|nr:hypothetical protein FF38_00537 [Lucilia cuprina]
MLDETATNNVNTNKSPNSQHPVPKSMYTDNNSMKRIRLILLDKKYSLFIKAQLVSTFRSVKNQLIRFWLTETSFNYKLKSLELNCNPCDDAIMKKVTFKRIGRELYPMYYEYFLTKIMLIIMEPVENVLESPESPNVILESPIYIAILSDSTVSLYEA